MRRLNTAIALCFLFFVASLCFANSRPGKKVSFNQDWRFQLGDVSNAQDAGFNDSQWRKLNPAGGTITKELTAIVRKLDRHSSDHVCDQWNTCAGGCNLIKFELTGQGAIVGVDNGNQISYESFKAKRRKAFHGIALAIIQANEKPGRIVLKASSDNLPSASLVINTR